MKYLTIGQLARKAEVNIDTIRYYERRGLISPSNRKESGYRQYLDDTVVRIHFIKHAKELGFSLDEIAELLSLKLDPKTKCGDVRKKAQEKINEIEGKIQILERMRQTLVRLTRMCEEGRQVSECPVLEALDENPGVEEARPFGRGRFERLYVLPRLCSFSGSGDSAYPDHCLLRKMETYARRREVSRAHLVSTGGER
ncbi:MAG: heavy metal-responsive transcriptional regulator [Nitrospiraceae bacterium]|nr:heavy metal-responsive transcriptional regulator [Nitrospiraceae bacterium]